MRHTTLSEKFDLQLPLVQAPMAGGATTPALIAAVSNAGALGSLGAGYMSASDIKAAIREIRSLSNKPFAVNLFIPENYHVTTEQMKAACYDVNRCCKALDIEIEGVSEPYAPAFEEQISVLIEEKVPIFSFIFGTLDAQFISQFKENNTFLIGTATTLAEAKILEKSGIDAVVAQGSEAGGHRGSFLDSAENSLIDLFSLLAQLREQIKIPIIAAGGIMNAQKIVAALAAGADGVQMGTAFLTCFESGIPAIYKQALLKQKHDKTVLTRAFTGKLARGIRNKFIDCMEKKKSHILDYPVQHMLTSKMRKKASELKNSDFISMWAGESAPLCKRISARDFIHLLIMETMALSKKS